MKKKGKKYLFLNPMDEDTMKKDHINATWRRHKRARKDGMVVVTVITNQVVHCMKYHETHRRKSLEDYQQRRPDAENLALDIEKALQERFRDDPRLDHGDEYTPGPSAEHAEAFPLYIAFRYWRKKLPSSGQKQVSTCKYQRYNVLS